MEPSALNALSPVDGRYAAAVAPLREYFSESALIRERIRVEALWFLRLTEAPAPMLRAPVPAAVRACAPQSKPWRKASVLASCASPYSARPTP